MLDTPLTALVLVAALALPPAPGAAAFQSPRLDDEADVDEGPVQRLLHPADFAARRERDAEIAFGSRTASSALAALAQPDLGTKERTWALVALGASRTLSERGRLESWAVEGPGPVRIAAILALGEMGAPDPTLLLRLVRDAESAYAEAALLALARGGGRAGLEFLRETADDPDHPLQDVATNLLIFQLDPGAAEETRVLRSLLDLRFHAAREHGLVLGQAWEVVVLQDLITNDRVLNRVVYPAAAELSRSGVRDHFLEVLLAGPSSSALRSAVEAMPTELSEMVASKAWMPPDLPAWRTILDAIDAGGLAPLCDGLLRRAWRIERLRLPASVLLARAGVPDGLGLLELDLESEDAAVRRQIAEGLGGTGILRYVDSLAPLLDDDDASVRAAVRVAQVRLGDLDARASVLDDLQEAWKEFESAREEGGRKAVLAWEPDPEYAELLAALVRHPADPSVQTVLLELLERPTPASRTPVAVALCRHGRDEARATLREILDREAPSGRVGAERVAALARVATSADLDRFRAMFPLEAEPILNSAIALELLRVGDPAVLPLLHSALWRGPWNRSCLAAALLVDVAGIEALRFELQHPPIDAGPRDMRRVGFALGEWGGLPQVESLAERLSSGHPALQGALLGALAARTH